MTSGNSANLKRVAFSPGEFATLFGKSQTWGYRQIYAGKVKAITEHGRILIPAAEVERILQTAGIYDGLKPKPPGTKAEIQRLAPKHPDAWKTFLAKRRDASGVATVGSGPRGAPHSSRSALPSSGRKAALDRLKRKPR